MFSFLPAAVTQGLEEARRAEARRSSRLCLHVNDRIHRVLKLWPTGLALDLSDAAPIRGHVDLYDGPTHLYQCLITASRLEGEYRIYDFKWMRPVDDQPAADFERKTRTTILLPRP